MRGMEPGSMRRQNRSPPGRRAVGSWTLAVVLAFTPWLVRGEGHPWSAGWTRLLDPSSRPAEPPDAALHEALGAVASGLEPKVPLALRWQAPHDPSALGFVWVTAAYRLAPRPVFPLLHADELEALVDAGQLDERLAAELGRRSTAVGRGDGVAVVWGDATPCRLSVPGLEPVHREGPVCRLRADGAAP